jgi:O-acetyl-ADP-ribose deacetylase (regulator of RNase III)
MFVQRKGNLVLSDDNHGFIVHGCNAQGVMGGGIALAIKQRWPKVYVTYRNDLRMGSAVPVMVDQDRVVINAITQRYYNGHPKAHIGRQVDYEAILQCFEKINDLPKYYPKIKPILHFPSIGAGLGGGDWDVIAEIIDTTITSMEKVHWIL